MSCDGDGDGDGDGLMMVCGVRHCCVESPHRGTFLLQRCSGMAEDSVPTACAGFVWWNATSYVKPLGAGHWRWWH